MAKAKRVVDVESLGVPTTSIKAMVRTLGNMLGDEVYFKPVLEIESSEQVCKAFDAVLEGVKNKQSKPGGAGGK